MIGAEQTGGPFLGFLWPTHRMYPDQFLATQPNTTWPNVFMPHNETVPQQAIYDRLQVFLDGRPPANANCTEGIKTAVRHGWEVAHILQTEAIVKNFEADINQQTFQQLVVNSTNVNSCAATSRPFPMRPG